MRKKVSNTQIIEECYQSESDSDSPLTSNWPYTPCKKPTPPGTKMFIDHIKTNRTFMEFSNNESDIQRFLDIVKTLDRKKFTTRYYFPTEKEYQKDLYETKKLKNWNQGSWY